MNIDKQDERLLHEILSKYKQGLISGLIQGNNVTFTSTGCRNKVISSTGGGGDFDLYEETTNYPLADPNTLTGDEVFFIAGDEGLTLTLSTLVAIIEENVLRSGFYEKEQVNVSRAFQSSDKNKILMLNTGVMLSIPVGEVFSNGDILAVTYAIDNQDPTTGFNTTLGGHLIVPFVTMDGIPNEIVYLSALNVDGQTTLLPISTFIKPDASDEQVKTGLRYLMDNNSGTQFIPLVGTEVGSPVTGDIDFANANIIFNNIDGDKFIKFGFNTATDETGLYFDNGLDPQTRFSIYNGDIQCYMPIGSYFSFANDYLGFSNNGNSSFVGIRGGEDYSNIITDLDYTQKIYVGFRGTATLSSGTVTVTTDKIKTGYKIYLSVNTPSGTQGFLSAPTGSIVDETEFVINSTSATDDSTVNWWIAP